MTLSKPTAGVPGWGGAVDAIIDHANATGVLLDTFTGATDDDKLTTALTQMEAATYPPTLLLGPRQYTFAVGGRVAFKGLRIQGPPGYGNPEQSQTKMPHRVHLTMDGPWFTNPLDTTVFSVSLRQLTFTGTGTATILGQNGAGNWWCLSMRDIFTHNLRSVLGTQDTKIRLTAASFTGDWCISNCTNSAFHLTGSDNALWTDGCLIDSQISYNTTGNAVGFPHLWCDWLEKTKIGPLYITAQGPWAGIQIDGPAFNTVNPSSNQGGPLFFEGVRCEGGNYQNPCYGAVVRQNGGLAVLRDSWFSYAMSNPSALGRSPVDAGVIHHAGGTLIVDGCVYDRAEAVAETVPFVYTSSDADCRVSNIMRAAKGGAWTGRPRVAKPTANAENRTADNSVTLITV